MNRQSYSFMLRWERILCFDFLHTLTSYHVFFWLSTNFYIFYVTVQPYSWIKPDGRTVVLLFFKRTAFRLGTGTCRLSRDIYLSCHTAVVFIIMAFACSTVNLYRCRWGPYRVFIASFSCLFKAGATGFAGSLSLISLNQDISFGTVFVFIIYTVLCTTW